MEQAGGSTRRVAAGVLQRRPCVTCAVLFIVGIALHRLFPIPPGAGVCCAIACAVGAILAHRQFPVLACLAVGGGVLCCGAASARIEGFYYPRHDIGAFTGESRRLARIELELDEPPRVLAPLPTGPAWSAQPRQSAAARVLRILTRRGWVPAGGRTLLQIEPPDDRLKVGQRIRVLGMLQRPAGAMNPGQFDWSDYYRAQRLGTLLSVSHPGAIQILSDGKPSPLARLRLAVRGLLARGFTSAQSLDHALLRALVLGDNDPELSDVREQFRRTGTSHHLAISGMHVAILGAFVFILCKLLRVRPRGAAVIAVTFVALYGAVALPSPPVLRSVIVWVAVALAIVCGRRTDALHLLAVSVLGILVFSALDLFDAGFQLSFGTVLGMMLLSKHALPLLRDPDAEIALTSRHGNPPKRLVIAHWLRMRFGVVLLAGVIAWIVSMPLIVYHFSQLNPWAVLASLLLAIPVTASLIFGFLKIILTAICPWGAHLWAVLAALPVSLMRHSVDALARLPGSDVPLPSHSILFVALYYGLVLLFVVPAARPTLRRACRLGPACAVMLLALIPLTGGASRRIANPSLRLTVLSVGAGQCCVLELPDGRIFLLDAGSNSVTDPVRKCILPFLRSRGRFQVDQIWLADSDFDHIGAASEIMRRFGVNRIVTGGAWDRHARATATGEDLLASIATTSTDIRRLHRGDHIPLGAGAFVDVLWPRPDEPLIMNNSDLVLKLTYARRTILLPSDVQEPAMMELLKHPEQLHCDVMLAPHHGSAERATGAFVAAADPLYIVSSNDNSLTQKQRRFERQLGDRPLLRTNTSGAVTILVDKNGGLTVTPFIKRNPQN